MLKGTGSYAVVMPICAVALTSLTARPALGQCEHFYTGSVIDPDPNAPESVALADLDGDGILDLAFSSLGGDLSVLFGVGDGTFAGEVRYPVGSLPEEVVAGELDGRDGIDLVVVHYDDVYASIFLNDGAGGFTESAIAAESGYRVAIGDLTGDDVADLAIAHPDNDTVSLWLNNGDGTFTAGDVLDTLTTVPAGIAIGDMDGINGGDIIVAGIQFSVEQFLNNGDGTFTQERHHIDGSYSFGCTVADADGDGDLDIGLPHWWGDATATVMLNNGDATYAASTYETGGWAAEQVAFADLDGRGGPEFIVLNNGTSSSGTPGLVSVWTGDGMGGFSDRCTYDVGAVRSTGMAIGDLDGDTSNDVVVASYLDGVCTVLMGEAPPGCAGDIDGDLDTDLADLDALLATYDKCLGDDGYNPDADFDASDCVDLSDLAFLLADYNCGT